jgi:hypothetical protein
MVLEMGYFETFKCIGSASKLPRKIRVGDLQIMTLSTWVEA